MASISTIWKPVTRPWNGGSHGCARSSGRMANTPLNIRHRNRTANLRIHGRKSNNRSPQHRPGMGLTKPCGGTGTASSKMPGKPVPHCSTQRATWTSSRAVQTIAENGQIPAKSRAPLFQALENHQHYLSTRKHILDYPGEVERHMDARTSLRDVAADREIELTGASAYPGWRQEAERPDGGGRGHPLRQGEDLWRPS